MSFILNPSLAVQTSLSMIGALSCVEFLREVPLYLSGKGDSSYQLLISKLILALVIVTIIMYVLFTFATSEHKPVSAVVPA